MPVSQDHQPVSQNWLNYYSLLSYSLLNTRMRTHTHTQARGIDHPFKLI